MQAWIPLAVRKASELRAVAILACALPAFLAHSGPAAAQGDPWAGLVVTVQYGDAEGDGVDHWQDPGMCVGYPYRIYTWVEVLRPQGSGSLESPGTLDALNPSSVAVLRDAQTGEVLARSGKRKYHTLRYLPREYGDGRAVLLAELQVDDGPLVNTTIEAKLRHCLTGTWDDGMGRTLEIEQHGTYVTANVTAGELCSRTDLKIMFTGFVEGEVLDVENLVVCEPKECGKDGRERKDFPKRWQADIRPDSFQITGDWEQEFFNPVTRQSPGGTDKVVGCEKTSRSPETVTYSIVRETGLQPYADAPPDTGPDFPPPPNNPTPPGYDN